MDYAVVAQAMAARNEDSLIIIPEEETLDYIEYLINKKADLIEDIISFAFYLKPYIDFMMLIKKEATEQELQDFLSRVVYRQSTFISNVLKCKNQAVDHIVKKMNFILSNDFSYVRCFIDYAIKHNKKELIDELVNSSNYNIRGRALEDLVARYYVYYKKHYSKNLESLMKSDQDIIPVRYASSIASYLAVYEKREYYRVMEFILKNYEGNYVLEELSNNSLDHYLGHKETTNMGFIQESQAIEDINILFNSYAGNKYDMYKLYGKYLNPETQRKYQAIERFSKADWRAVSDVFSSTIYEKLMDVVAKYASKTTGNIKVAGRGSRATAFLVGDTIIKCSDGKWTQNKSTSISSFLVLRNIEEHYEYDETGRITQAIEVQPYLRRKVSVFRRGIIRRYKEEFARQGYECSDLLLNNFLIYDNLRFLEDYHDADCEDPEALPDWFKQTPVVLIDADLVKSKK